MVIVNADSDYYLHDCNFNLAIEQSKKLISYLYIKN